MTIACKHALASAINGSKILSHGKVQAAIGKPSLSRAMIPEIELLVIRLNEASKLILMVSLSGGFQTESLMSYLILHASRLLFSKSATNHVFQLASLLHVENGISKPRKTCCVKEHSLKRWSTDSSSDLHTGHKGLTAN
ncbi:hypothetical protein ES288_A07G162800v1 [Gossypium darwinii]|uniref:Uncharacterized protein n=1 Tax=Gossypium darwinii TaxID=34276 RepID=A0A5D2FW71_GOSDA|nr:hypothetical protein ES288_A07G162800v1 [Gossypium darwinii]